MKMSLRKYWLGIVALIVFIVAVILSAVLPTQVQVWDVKLQAITASVGWVLFLFQYLYAKSEKFYIWAHSLQLWLTNEPTKWNFTVDLGECMKEDPLDEVWQTIGRHGQKVTLWHRDDSSLIVNMPGYAFRAFISGNPLYSDNTLDGSETICIQVSNLELPFRSFRSRIENEAIPLIQDITDSLQPSTQKYAVKIGFSSTNPYFGFFVRRLNLPQVVSFTCDLIESGAGGHDQMVSVRKDKIEIVTDNLLSLQTLSMKYVRLATN